MGFPRAFDKTEFERRVTDVRQRMADAGFDVIICQDPANMSWLTGFDGWSFYTPQAVVVHQEESWPIWFGREQDAKSAHITTDLPAQNIIGFSEPLVHHARSTRLTNSPNSFVAAVGAMPGSAWILTPTTTRRARITTW